MPESYLPPPNPDQEPTNQDSPPTSNTREQDGEMIHIPRCYQRLIVDRIWCHRALWSEMEAHLVHPDSVVPWSHSVADYLNVAFCSLPDPNALGTDRTMERFVPSLVQAIYQMITLDGEGRRRDLASGQEKVIPQSSQAPGRRISSLHHSNRHYRIIWPSLPARGRRPQAHSNVPGVGGEV